MPIVNGAYDAPTWINNAPPAIDASELQDMCDTIETYNTQKADVDYVNTFVRPNLLDNWYFVGGGSQQGGGQFPINQRGDASYSGATQYTIDRWRTSNTNTTVSVVSSGLTVSASSGTTPYLLQQIENVEPLRGKPVTVSFLVGGVLYSATGTFPTTDPSSTSTYFSSTGIGHLLYLSGSWYLRFTGSSGESKTYTAVKLEIGDTQTLAHQESGEWVLNEVPNFQQELAKCQRFQTFLFGASNYGRIGIGVADTATAIHVNIPIPTSMRIDVPALTFLAGSISDIFLWDAAANTYVSITTWNVTASRTSGWLELNIESSGLTAGKPYILRTKANAVQVLADANL